MCELVYEGREGVRRIEKREKDKSGCREVRYSMVGSGGLNSLLRGGGFK